MKKNILFRIAILTSFTLLLTACPYESKVPISKPIEKVDKGLLGKWIAGSDREYDNPTYYTIKKNKSNKLKYEIMEYSYSSYDSAYSEKLYTMHTSTVGTNRFMNVQDNGQGIYYLHMFELNEDNFILYEISDNIDETYTKSEDLASFIEKNMELSFFFNRSEITYFEYK